MGNRLIGYVPQGMRRSMLARTLRAILALLLALLRELWPVDRLREHTHACGAGSALAGQRETFAGRRALGDRRSGAPGLRRRGGLESCDRRRQQRDGGRAFVST